MRRVAQDHKVLEIMGKRFVFFAFAVLLMVTAACVPKIDPTPSGNDNKLKPTGKSVSTYMSLHVTDNRSSYRKMAVVADKGRVLTGSAQPNSPEAVREAIAQGMEFVRIDVRRSGNESYCTDHIEEGDIYPKLEDVLSESRGKIFVCLDASHSLHIPNTCALIDSLAMQDEIIFCMGALGGPDDDQSASNGWRNYLEFSSRLDKVTPLFDASCKEAIDFIESSDLPAVVSFRLGDNSLAGYCHNSGFAVFTDVTASDESIKEGDNAALQQAAALKSDLVCTGVADSDIVRFYSTYRSSYNQ